MFAGKPYRIEVTRQGNKYLCRVLQEDSYDQREGTSYIVVAVALASTYEDALRDATQEAFN